MTNFLRGKEKVNRQHWHNNDMTSRTRDFIQKICYRRTASVDMTRYGFISDSKLHPVNLLLKPLRQQLEKICAKVVHSSRKQSPIKGMTSPKTRRVTKHNKKKKPSNNGKKDLKKKLQEPNIKRKKK